ncbi:MAG TPA: SoxR reducing system RseC family protein [Ignavibacteriaceae bacterium]
MTKRIMYKEELYEDGIVKESKNGLATIIISDSDHCEECSAKLYCKPGNSNERSLTAADPYGVNPGDKVRVTIKGSKILSAAFLLYGVPLILLIGGLFLGMQIFSNNKELFSTLLSIGCISFYMLFVYFFSRKSKQNTASYPEIVFVNTPKL